MVEYSFKILVIGPAAVGKSSLIRRFVHNQFSLDYHFTIGVDFSTKLVEYEPSKIAKLTIWDIGGQDRFKILRRNFYEGAHGALIVFDLSRAETFSQIKNWIFDMYQIMRRKIPIVLLGNKVDLLSDIGEVIDQNEPYRYAEKENSFYFETSAKTGNNVEKAFIEITQTVIKRFF